MPPPFLQLASVRLTFGGDPLLTNAALSVGPGDRIALVGRNGSGKSTLLKIAAGLVEGDSGQRFVDPAATVAYLPQEPDLSGFATVADYVAGGPAPPPDAFAANRLLDELALSPSADVAALSGGEARRAALARVFALAPNILLLDEPTNHLDLPAIAWLEEHLAGSKAGIVVISHDRRFLEAVTTKTVWIDRGETRGLDRGFAAFEAWRDKLLEEEEAASHKLDRKIVAEEHWVRYGVTARRKRNTRRMRELADMRRERREARRLKGDVVFSASGAGPSGKRVIVAQNISKFYGDRAIIKDFSIEIARGDRVGLVGPNGAGKTTLLNLLTGVLAPDSGVIEIGARLDIVSLDQKRAALDNAARLADAITDGRGDWVEVGGEKRHVASYLKDFLFTPEQYRAPVSSLSGGERGRLALAAALARPSNLLVLDEPTNDLDLETLDLLEEFIAGYPGTLLLVSHDRSFLDRTVTSVVTTSPDRRPGKWIEYVGGFTDMVAQRGGVPGFEPKGAPIQKSAGSQARSKGPAPGSRLSYKEKFKLEQLPARIAALEAEIIALRKSLADPSLFARDGASFNRHAEELARAEQALALAEEDWLLLEEKREALERERPKP